MKLVKINKNTYINPERIDSIEYYPSVDVTNVVINGYTIRLEDTPIKKVLDAISGSEEYLNTKSDFYIENGNLILEKGKLASKIFNDIQVKGIKFLINY